MPPVCTVCPHEHRREIDNALVLGQSSRSIAGRYGIGSKSTVDRHRSCIVDLLAKADKRQAGRIASRVEGLIGKLERMADECETEKLRGAFLATVRELRPTYELGAKLSGEMQTASVQAFLSAMGVRTEAEVRDALSLTRMASSPQLEDCREESLALLLMCHREHPEWQAQDLARLGAPVLLTNGNGHHDTEGPHATDAES